MTIRVERPFSIIVEDFYTKEENAVTDLVMNVNNGKLLLPSTLYLGAAQAKLLIRALNEFVRESKYRLEEESTDIPF